MDSRRADAALSGEAGIVNRQVIVLPAYIARQRAASKAALSSSSSSSSSTQLGAAAGFACLREGQHGTMVVRIQNWNVHLTAPLEKLFESYGAELNEKDEWRQRNMRKLIEFLKRLPRRLASADELFEAARARGGNAAGVNPKGTGSTADKVREIFTTGTCTALEARCSSEAFTAMRLFTTVWGIGPVKARMLALDHGLRSIEELRRCVFGGPGGRDPVPDEPLNTKSGSPILGAEERECLRHHEDLVQRMAHSEAGEFVARVQEAAGRVFGGLDKVLVVGAGSFRRGKPTCGDVDVLITTQDFGAPLLDISMLLDELHRTGLLVYDLRRGGGEEHYSVNDRIRTQERNRALKAQKKIVERAAKAGIVMADSDDDIDVGLAPTATSAALRPEGQIGRVFNEHVPGAGGFGPAGSRKRPRGHAVPAAPETIEGITFLSRETEEMTHHLYMGLGRLPATDGGERRRVRRIDIKIYERPVFAFALLYFTGSDYFNRSLRLLVQKCGWTLSDKGLCRATRVRNPRGGGFLKVWTGPSIACNTERDILTACGVPWREPRDRDMEVIETDAAAASMGSPRKGRGAGGGVAVTQLDHAAAIVDAVDLDGDVGAEGEEDDDDDDEGEEGA